MTSEGAIFRRAYGALDRVAPAAPAFAELGMARAVATAPGAPRRQLMMAAGAVAALIVAIVPVVLFSTNPGSFWSSQMTPTTSTISVATTAPGLCVVTTTTIYPVPTTQGNQPPTTPPTPAVCDDPPSASTTTQAPGTTVPGAGPPFEPDQIQQDGAAVLTEFLVAMHERRFADAASMLTAEHQGSTWTSGVVLQLEFRHPEVEADDLPALLAASCETTPFCEQISSLQPEGVTTSSDPNLKPTIYRVIFEDADGNPIFWSADDEEEPYNHQYFHVTYFQEQGFHLIADLPLPRPEP